MCPKSGQRGRKKSKPFRYEVAWESHKDFAETVKHNWAVEGPSNTLEELQYKMSTLSADLPRWGERSFGNVQWQIRELQRELGCYGVRQIVQDRVHEKSMSLCG
jgi:hypothetical protein